MSNQQTLTAPGGGGGGRGINIVFVLQIYTVDPWTIDMKRYLRELQYIMVYLLFISCSIFAIYEVTGGDTSEKKKKLLFGSNIRDGAVLNKNCITIICWLFFVSLFLFKILSTALRLFSAIELMVFSSCAKISNSFALVSR
jgi:hypothetical protein